MTLLLKHKEFSFDLMSHTRNLGCACDRPWGAIMGAGVLNRANTVIDALPSKYKALFFSILGLPIFFQNIKVGGGKKKLLKKFFLFHLKHNLFIWIGEKTTTKIV